jgi:hypothetical protein
LFVDIIAVATAVMGAFHLFFDYLRRSSAELVVTDQRFIYKQGHILPRTSQTLLSKIAGVDVSSSLWGKILGYGTVTIASTGSSLPPIDHVAEPWRLHFHILFMLRRLSHLSEAALPHHDESVPEPPPKKLGQSR